MGYQSRMRNYKSRRERYEQSTRNIRIIFIFAIIALVVFLFKERYEIWGWLKTYFY
ncbi:MAG: hypothetical protein MRY78_10805 [Saprospiraceae bacterium]|nr:hypothetical protein [Saprospiraceae bacterium]